ncbi:alpha/beta fold hydrolase [Bacillus sp. V2I10]|uniref:alpha/beta fold hydrolase n=1 Tax=Bacillus sp. V2I10 TaxID=3042276 RepID=UPI002783F982|nr:alpha/beta hydrolase [Bacillus sp. V2I10]MDQ0861288.1 pimeloyl-ACP methyl ester carboxylesterase [Bacillus sp. V2I10]
MIEIEGQENEQIGLVFIQGAGLESRIWEPVVSEIKSPFLLVNFPEREGENGLRQSLTLQDYNAYIKRQIEAWKVRKFIIVAHSLGGVLALKIANDLSESLVGFIAIGATIPKNGGSFLSTFPFAKRFLMNVLLRVFGTKPPESSIRKGLCNDLSPEQATEVVRGFVPESIHIYTDRTKAIVPTNVPKLYIKLTKDQEMSLSQQDKMIGNLAPQKIEMLETGHLPMLIKPNELRNSLNAFLAQLELH